MMEVMHDTTMQAAKAIFCITPTPVGSTTTGKDETAERIKPVLSNNRNNISSFQFTSNTIHNINIAGMEKNNEHANTNPKVSGQ